jgi:UDP-N-acetyl-D-mannosaminuronic acid dehydrogenase
MKILVIGTGYVGLPTAILLAEAGHDVIGVDIRKEVVDSINTGTSHIKESGIEDRLKKVVGRKLIAKQKPESGDVFIICVQTPMNKETKKSDMSYIKSATNSITPYLKSGNLVILESTVPPKTTRKIVKKIIETETRLNVGEDIYLVYSPERLLPGNAFHELVHNSRIIGGINKRSSEKAKQVFSSFIKGPLEITDDLTAELVKLMENTYRDTNIALANELSLVAESLGIDINHAIKLANKHPRVNIHKSGIGVGGHCLPKDPWFIVETDSSNTNIIQWARKTNDSMPLRVVEKIKNSVENIEKPRILLLGLTYKPDCDDTRNSPALEILKILKQDGYDVVGLDPYLENCKYTSIEESSVGVDCIALLVNHKEIKDELQNKRADILSKMNTKNILEF